jgi:hypothetical protein
MPAIVRATLCVDLPLSGGGEESPRQALFYPFAPKRDLIDASSRIYDMNATAPVQNEGRLAEPRSYADS